MSKQVIQQEIRDLLDVIKEQQELILTYNNTIPQIEMDILMANIRKLYENLMQLNKLNNSSLHLTPFQQTAPIPAPVEPTSVPEPVHLFHHTDELIAALNTEPIEDIDDNDSVEEQQPVTHISQLVEVIENNQLVIEEEKVTNVHVHTQPVSAVEVPVQQKTIEEIKTDIPQAEPVKESHTHLQPEALITSVDTPVQQQLNEIVKEEVLPQAALAKERTKEYTKPSNKVHATASLFDDTPTIGEKFQASKSHHDKIASESDNKSLAVKMQKNPVTDLKKSIGINEKFSFINELFDGDLNSYNEAIDSLNNSENHQHAMSLLNSDLTAKYNWNGQSDSFIKLKDLVDRRFTA